jgi:hypothetical protein
MFQSEEEKLNIIQNKLSEGVRNVNAEIHEDELLEILDQNTASGVFNRELFTQLTNQIHKNNENLTIKNFSLIWLQAEQRLSKNIVSLSKEIEELKDERDNYIKLKNENQEHERLNANNIMQGSELNVKINVIQHIVNQNNQPGNANFILGCEGQTAETGISDNPHMFNVDKTFKFEIKTGEEPLTITMVGATNLDNEPDGIIDIDLKELKDQHSVTHDINFYYDQNRMLPTVMNLELLWIYSYVKLYNDSITQINKEIYDNETQIENSETFLSDLYAPFKSIRRESPYTKRNREVKEVYNPHLNQVVDKKFSRIPVDTNPNVSKFLLFVVYFYVFFALITSFDRVVFLDLLMSLLLFSSLQLNMPMFVKSFANKIIFGIIAAIILDSVWLTFYLKPWWWTGYEDGFSLLMLRRTMIVFSFILMLVRLLVLIAIFLTYSNLQTAADEFDNNDVKGFDEQTFFHPHSSGNQDYPGL